MTAIYVTESGSNLQVKHDRLLVYHQQQLCYKVPINQVSQIILFGHSHLEREVTSLALFRRLPILFLDNQGTYLGRYKQRHCQPKYLQHQLKRSRDVEFIFDTAQSMIRAKLHNSYTVLQQLTSSYSTCAANTAMDVMLLLMDDLYEANSVNALWEYVAMADTFYYPALGSLLLGTSGFQRRKKHPPTDRIDSLLTLGDTLLNQIIYCFVRELGLHPDFANLHVNSQTQTPLVCDFMTEFRAFLVDELVAELAISQAITPNDFTPASGQCGVHLCDRALKTFLQHWENKLQTQVTHPYAGKVSYRQCLELQVREYIACLLGDVEFYRPLLLKLNPAPVALHPSDKQHLSTFSSPRLPILI